MVASSVPLLLGLSLAICTFSGLLLSCTAGGNNDSGLFRGLHRNSNVTTGFGPNEKGKKIPLPWHSPLKLDYGIFRGRSSFRNILPEDIKILFDKDYCPELSRSKALLALSLLLRRRGDEAHEVILGVHPNNNSENNNNIRDAEWAATHPGESGWSDRYPLSDTDDMIHSLIHRYEGDLIGEGNHTGYENAKYWASGGPKQYEMIPPLPIINNRSKQKHPHHHPVPWQLARFALKRTPHAVSLGVVAEAAAAAAAPCSASEATTTTESNQQEQGDSGTAAAAVREHSGCSATHEIIADRGRRRNVSVRSECWDPIRFIDILSGKLSSSSSSPSSDRTVVDRILLQAELECLQEEEIRLLIQYEILRLSGISDKDICQHFLDGDHDISEQ